MVDGRAMKERCHQLLDSVTSLQSLSVPSLTIAGLLMPPKTPRGFRLAVGVLPPA